MRDWESIDAVPSELRSILDAQQLPDDMREMFNGATVFNGDLSGWSLGKVTDIQYMFNGASAFTSDLAGWNVAAADVTDLFLEAVTASPANADLHAVLGVLYNLSRSYTEAMASFEEALRLRPEQ